MTDSDLHLENDASHFTVHAHDNTWSLLDKQTGVCWGNEVGDPWATLIQGAGPQAVHTPLSPSAVEQVDGALRCRLEGAALAITFRLTKEALQVYLVPDEGTIYDAVELFPCGLQASVAEAGDALLPVRMGLLMRAQGEPFDLHLDTYAYEGVHLAMSALFKSGAALMATWGDPYVLVNLSREGQGAAACLHMSFTLRKTARSLELRCLGAAGLPGVAAAYRQRAEALGYRVTWEEKLKTRPQAERLFGACNFKLWHALARRVDENLVEQSVEVQYSFDEVAQVAEHLRHDLQLDDVLFHLGGWTRYGYDCRHPDIMPANPECGGNEGLADCARRVKACSYLFCLHDNYQDMYRDAPSWDEAAIEKDADGSWHLGGVWLGGRAYYTCAREAVKLAQRPQNLPLVRDTFHPDLYFIDTTYAVGLQECYDPRHPLTRQDDLRWKQELSNYARDVFGLFGSECGREWAVPCADFFEGLASVSGRYYHQLEQALGSGLKGGRVVPFFDMVYRDCIAIHGKYGYKPEQMAEQVIHHIAMGRTLYYHSVGKHLYWQDPATHAELPPAEGPYDPSLYTRAHNGWAEGMCLWDRFMKNTQEVLGPLYKLTAQALISNYEFLDHDRLIRRTTYSNGVVTTVNGSASDCEVSFGPGGATVLPPYGFLVQADGFLALCAVSWGGRRYASPVLFTLTSLDGRPLAQSRQVRTYHGFGEAELPWRGGVLAVQREEIVNL
jgi:hypothetical protein